MAETQTRTTEEIEHAFTLSMSEVRGILNLIQVVAETGDENNVKPGTISGAADGAMRALEASHDVFEEMMVKCMEAKEVQS